MQLVATLKATGDFFRAQTVLDNEINAVKSAMQADISPQELVFLTMTDAEFDAWPTAQ